MRLAPVPALTITVMLLLMTGSDDDERLAWFATEAAREQAAQSRRMADLQQQIAKGTNRLVEADAHSRAEFTRLHRDLQAERTEVGHQRDALEADRRVIADQRRADPIIAAANESVGLTLPNLLPLGVAWQLLGRAGDEPVAVGAAELLLEDLTSDAPRLLGPARPVELLHAAAASSRATQARRAPPPEQQGFGTTRAAPNVRRPPRFPGRPSCFLTTGRRHEPQPP